MPAFPKPKLQRFAEEESSVVESPLKKGARKILNLVGGDVTDAINPLQAPASPLISIYKNAATRAIGTKKTGKQLEKLVDYLIGRGDFKAAENLQAAGQDFIKRYPRVAAHTEFMPDVDNRPGMDYLGRTMLEQGKVTRPIQVDFSERGIKHFSGKKGAANARDTVFHEALHVAQSLGNKYAKPMYDATMEALGDSKDYIRAYLGNPFEQNAFARGLKEAGYTNPRPKPVNEGLNEILKKRPSAQSQVRGQGKLAYLMEKQGTRKPIEELRAEPIPQTLGEKLKDIVRKKKKDLSTITNFDDINRIEEGASIPWAMRPRRTGR